MPDSDDNQLIAEYARDNSEAAFTALVTRHINLVYSVALRHTSNAHGAEEITQAVFLILARKAKRLSPRAILSGWLYQTTRLTAANYLRTETRRRQREQEAYMQSRSDETRPGADETWRQIAPLLDDALAKLDARDRDAIVLRFFENKSGREIAAALRVEEPAAHKRVTRAVAKLRKFFVQRGVMFPAAAIVGAVSANSVHAAPAGLVTTISTTVIQGSAVATSTLTLVKGALKLMAWTKLKTTVVVGVVAVLAATTSLVVVKVRLSALTNANVVRAKTGIPTDPTALAQATSHSKILIFRNVRSWNRKLDFEETLTNLGFRCDVKKSRDMGDTDLSSYDVVIIPGAQWGSDYYARYAEHAALFDSYVSNGGTLVLELNGAEKSGIVLPHGVKMVSHGAVDNFLTLPEHPILLPLDGRPIHANWASHGYLSGVPADATVLAVEMNCLGPVVKRPTFIEYNYGAGRVIAACQCFHDQDGSGRGPMMPTLIAYAAVKQWFSPK